MKIWILDYQEMDDHRPTILLRRYWGAIRAESAERAARFFQGASGGICTKSEWWREARDDGTEEFFVGHEEDYTPISG